MGSTTTQTSIANRALQILGYQQISSLSENSRGAKAMIRAYDPVRLSELRKNYWNFAIKRASLPADAVGPVFGKTNYFTLPPDFLCLAPPDEVFGISGGGMVAGNQVMSGSPIITGAPRVDWMIEGFKIATNQVAPLNLRYVSSDVPESLYDPCFAEALSAALAVETCEELTQSNTKLQNISNMYDQAIEMGKKRNAFEGRPVQPPTDTWIIARF